MATSYFSSSTSNGMDILERHFDAGPVSATFSIARVFQNQSVVDAWYSAVEFAVYLEMEDFDKSIVEHVSDRNKTTWYTLYTCFRLVPSQTVPQFWFPDKIFISDYGLLEFLNGCRKPRTDALRTWVIRELLPSLHELRPLRVDGGFPRRVEETYSSSCSSSEMVRDHADRRLAQLDVEKTYFSLRPSCSSSEMVRDHADGRLTQLDVEKTYASLRPSCSSSEMVRDHADRRLTELNVKETYASLRPSCSSSEVVRDHADRRLAELEAKLERVVREREEEKIQEEKERREWNERVDRSSRLVLECHHQSFQLLELARQIMNDVEGMEKGTAGVARENATAATVEDSSEEPSRGVRETIHQSNSPRITHQKAAAEPPRGESNEELEKGETKSNREVGQPPNVPVHTLRVYSREKDGRMEYEFIRFSSRREPNRLRNVSGKVLMETYSVPNSINVVKRIKEELKSWDVEFVSKHNVISKVNITEDEMYICVMKMITQYQ